ncbi:MAG TPA: hypothetical protein VNL14_15040 [Candidatus Acidoferrales bacterium]|nr:hypothetical protein [Candidatus Acidoferrales bacterium]
MELTGILMRFSMVPLLLHEKEIPAEIKRALRDGRFAQALKLLMEKFDLSCAEAGALLGVAGC